MRFLVRTEGKNLGRFVLHKYLCHPHLCSLCDFLSGFIWLADGYKCFQPQGTHTEGTYESRLCDKQEKLSLRAFQVCERCVCARLRACVCVSVCTHAHVRQCRTYQQFKSDFQLGRFTCFFSEYIFRNEKQSMFQKFFCHQEYEGFYLQ